MPRPLQKKQNEYRSPVTTVIDGCGKERGSCQYVPRCLGLDGSKLYGRTQLQAPMTEGCCTRIRAEPHQKFDRT